MSRDAKTREEQLTNLNLELQRNSDTAVLFNQAVAARVGVHPTDLKVLSLMTQSGAMTAGRIAVFTGLTTGAVTFIIDRLEKAGYVQRVRHPHDRRSTLVEPLMEPTIRDFGQFFIAMGQAMLDLAARYSDAEIAVILDFLQRANQAAQREIAHLRGADLPDDVPTKEQ